MAPPNEGDHAMMTALVLEEKQVRAKLEDARERFDLWRSRLRKAEEMGRADLFDEIERHLHEARAEGMAAKQTLERVEMDKAALRHESRSGADQAAAKHAQAEHLLGQFEAMGVRPEDDELRRVERDREAEDMLAALKARMGGD